MKVGSTTRNFGRFLTLCGIDGQSSVWAIVGVAVSLLMVWQFGATIVQGHYAVLFVPFGVLMLSLVLHQPIMGLVWVWVIMVLMPYGSVTLPLPVVDSPAMIVGFLTLALALARLMTRREPLIPSNLYGPMVVWAGVLILFAIIGHGPSAAYRAQWTLQGTWAFFLVILMVRTPRQAQSVLLALMLSFIVLALLWLPGMLPTGGLSLAGSSDEYSRYARNLWAEYSTPLSFGESLIVLFSTSGWQTFNLMAMVWPILFSLAISGSSRRLRWGAGLCSILILLPVLLSSYGVPLLMIPEGAVFVLAFTMRRSSLRHWSMAVILLSVLGGLILYTTGGQYIIQRVSSGSDPSVISRQAAWQQGIGAFLARPLVGWGAYNYVYATSSGHLLLGHSSFVSAAYEYGLIYLLPLAILLFRLGQNLVRLGRKGLTANDRAVVIGIQALFAVYIVQGFASGSMGHIGIDSAFWLCMGLVTVWLHWLESKTYDGLVA